MTPHPTRLSKATLITVAKWTPALVFLWGMLLLDPTDYFFPTALALAGYVLWILAVQGNALGLMPHLVLMTVFFFGYFIKIYLALLLPDPLKADLLVYPANYLVDHADLMKDTYVLSATAFFTFCVCASLSCCLFSHRSTFQHPRLNIASSTLFQQREALDVALYIGLICACGITGLLQYYYRIGLAGTEADSALPFRLGGLVHHMRLSFLPYFMIILIYLDDVQGRTWWANAYVALLLLHGLSQMLIISSRSTVALFGFSLGLLWIFTGKLTKQRCILLMVVIVTVIGLFDLITSLRGARATDHNKSLVESMHSVSRKYDQESVDYVLDAKRLLFRLTGMDGLITALAAGDVGPFWENVDTYFNDPYYSFERVFTQRVARHPAAGRGHLSAPGILALFFLLGGSTGVVVGIVCWFAAVEVVWKVFSNGKWASCCPILCFLSTEFLLASFEGGVGGLPIKLSVIMASFLLGELIVRQMSDPQSHFKRGHANTVPA